MLSKIKFVILFFFTLFSVNSYASEPITILWAFNIGSNQANTIRLIIDEANKSQNKYEFRLDGKPGAGGTTAANFVQDNPNNTLVGMSSSFFIRPVFEGGKNPVHNLDNYKPVLVQSEGSPLIFVSNKFTSIKDAVKQPNLSVGVSGIGSVSHLAANELFKKNPTATIVNFKNMIEASTAAGGGHVDIAVGFYADLKPLLDANKLNIIGYTGRKVLPPIGDLRLSNYGITTADNLTANYAIFASKQMDQKRFEEINSILNKANKTKLVSESYAIEFLSPLNLNINDSLQWYNSERKYWAEQVQYILK